MEKVVKLSPFGIIRARRLGGAVEDAKEVELTGCYLEEMFPLFVVWLFQAKGDGKEGFDIDEGTKC